MKATTARRFPIKKIVSGAAMLLFAAMLAALPRQCAAACAEGIALWAKAVLPSLLPFLAVSTLLAARGKKAADRLAPLMRRVKLPAAASLCLLLSVLSGYPVGSRAVAELAERCGIPREGVLRTAVLCSTSGPMFLLGTVGGMYADPAAGAVLFASHLAGVFLVCLLLLPFAKKLPESPPHEKQEESIPSLGESVQRAVLSVLCVGGFVALFYVLGEMLAALGAAGALRSAAPRGGACLRASRSDARLRRARLGGRAARPAADRLRRHLRRREHPRTAAFLSVARGREGAPLRRRQSSAGRRGIFRMSPPRTDIFIKRNDLCHA